MSKVFPAVEILSETMTADKRKKQLVPASW